MSRWWARSEAIELLASIGLASLTPKDILDRAASWWCDEWLEEEGVPGETVALVRESEGPRDPEDPRLVPILRLDLRSRYRGVANEYLRSKLDELGHECTAVAGEVEELRACPCCGYRTLDSRGRYDVCPVCFWEDEGDSIPDRPSACNRLSLAQARRNFLDFGACDRRCLEHVDPEGREKFARGSASAATPSPAGTPDPDSGSG